MSYSLERGKNHGLAGASGRDETTSERGLSILLIAHSLPVLRDTTDRIAVMHSGRLVEEAPTPDLFLRPRHPYSEKLLASIPWLNGPLLSKKERGAGPLAGATGCRYRAACEYAEAECGEDDPRPREVEPGRVVSCRRAEGLRLTSPLG